MAFITELSVQKKNKKRVNIFVDGEFFSGADALSVVKARLKVGDEVNPEVIKEVILESEVTSACEKAVNLLTSRLKSEKETEDYLLGKGYAEEVVLRAMQKLKEYGLADNKSFSSSYISHYSASMGRRGLRYGLLKKGVDDNTIEDALEHLSEEDEEQGAISVAERYMRNKEWSLNNRAKLYRHLIGKGFSSELVSKIVGEWDEN